MKTIRFINGKMIWNLFTLNKNYKKLTSLPIEKIHIEEREYPEKNQDYTKKLNYKKKCITEFLIFFQDKSAYIINMTIQTFCKNGHLESFDSYTIIDYYTNESLISGSKQMLSVIEKLENLLKEDNLN